MKYMTKLNAIRIDVMKIKSFFQECLVFDSHAIAPCLENIATGMVAPKNGNVHQAFEIGNNLIKSLRVAIH